MGNAITIAANRRGIFAELIGLQLFGREVGGYRSILRYFAVEFAIKWTVDE